MCSVNGTFVMTKVCFHPLAGSGGLQKQSFSPLSEMYSPIQVPEVVTTSYVISNDRGSSSLHANTSDIRSSGVSFFIFSGVLIHNSSAIKKIQLPKSKFPTLPPGSGTLRFKISFHLISVILAGIRSLTLANVHPEGTLVKRKTYNMKLTLIIHWLADRKLKIEWTLVTLVVLGVVLNLFSVKAGEYALLVAMVLLSLFYLISSYFPVEVESMVGTAAMRLAGISSALCVVGLLLTVLRLPGALELLATGTSILALVGIAILYLWLTSKAPASFPLLVRIAVLLGVSTSTVMELWELSKSVI